MWMRRGAISGLTTAHARGGEQKCARIPRILAIIVAICVASASAQTTGAQQELPDSPSATIAQATSQAQSSQPAANQSQPPTNQTQPSQAPTQSPQPAQKPGPPQKPLGTAAAEGTSVTGVAASNASGAAIAPAKQKRLRSLIIKVGAIVGAGVAIGTVAALSAGSPSKPPGSH